MSCLHFVALKGSVVPSTMLIFYMTSTVQMCNCVLYVYIAGLTPRAKVKQAVQTVCRVLLLMVVLYFFICSLGLLEDSFKLLGGELSPVFNSVLVDYTCTCIRILQNI